jgi:CDP-4-dehydro-6-deoxyglucose reductase, E1
MIPLMKNTFINEFDTKKKLSEFILNANKLSMDVNCFEFERKFAAFHETKHAVLVNSGASANLVLLQALLNLGRLAKGDKVGFSAVTWSTNVMPIIQLGLIPVPVDCDVHTLNCMQKDLASAHEKHGLKAFFLTNVLGFSGDLDRIKSYCDDESILFIEDNCESLGSRVNGKLTGNYGEAGTLSFFVAHHMSTIEGGMIVTDDDELAEMCIICRANGWDRNLSAVSQKRLRKINNVKSEFDAKYTFYDLAFNVRPTEITGFLGITQLAHLQENIRRREANYRIIETVCRSNDDFVKIDCSHMSFVSNFSFPFVCNTAALRDHYIKEFAGAGIEIRPMIAGNLQFQPFFKKYGGKPEKLKGADHLHTSGFYCGNYPELSSADIETISACILK